MSDDEAYKNLDLETAEEMYIQAGNPQQAKAARHVVHAVRNTVQGEWGKSFIASLEGLLAKYVNPLVDGQAGILAVVETTAADLGKLSGQVGEMGEMLRHTISRVSNIEETVQDHVQMLEQHGQAIAQTRAELTMFQGEVRGKFQQLESVLTKLATQQAMFQKLLAAHPAPDGLKK